jgi:hypothetical protein
MADEKNESDAAKTEGTKKKFPLKTLMMLGGVLLLEIITVLVAFTMAGGPAPVAADHTGANLLVDDGNKEAEELVIEERFANSRRGDVYLYDSEIYVVIRKKHQDKVKADLKSMSAQIHSDILTIFRRADPTFMHEDELQTLSRQIKAAMDNRLGTDADGEPIVRRVLITRCTEYRIDF